MKMQEAKSESTMHIAIASKVNVGVHQGSVMSPLLFIIVIEALSREFRTGCPWELLYADDLVISDKDPDKLEEMLCTWKRNLESHGLRVNMGKTKVMTWFGDTEGLWQAPMWCVQERHRQQCNILRRVLSLGAPQVLWNKRAFD